MEPDRKTQDPIAGESRRPFRAHHGGVCFPGLKPRAESCSPFGAINISRLKSRAEPCGRFGVINIPKLKPWTESRNPFGANKKAFVGASMVALFVAAMLQWAALLAVCPALHELIHHDADDEHHDCAVTLFLAGQVEQAFSEPIALRQSAPVELLLDRAYSTVVYGSFFLSRSILEHAPPIVR
jgi:hypothetical protein